MGVNRSGYYKWRQRKGTPNRHEQNRIVLTELLRTAHEKHPSHGYHRLALDVFSETGWVFSHNLAHKCCKAAGIRSKARKRRYQRPGEEHVLFANEVNGRWNAIQPLQLVVSDMTMFKVGILTGNGLSFWTPLTTRSLRTALHLKREATSLTITASMN